MLIVLRVTIGWHFLYQGIWKLENPDFSSAGFLGQAKGPLEDRFLALVPDYWGHERLDKQRVLDAIDDYRERFGRRFDLNDQQNQLADRVAKAHTSQVKDFFDEQKADMESYFHDLERLETVKHDPASELQFQKKRNWDKRQELQSRLKGWKNQLETWTSGYRSELAGILSDAQRKEIWVPDQRKFGMDDFITLSNVAIGFCLMIGLFTRTAALGGAVFLAMIVIAQPELPGVYPQAPAAAGRSLIVTKEFIEGVALLCLATLPGGRWGGLDFFIHYLIVQPLFGKRQQGYVG